ncbi:MAG: TonB-dependent receptor plug domain-containing protein [Bacteroidales bacterium]|nr:TonB-dependent receptor plug domain-containing protein [Bacteroidales bacterium]
MIKSVTCLALIVPTPHSFAAENYLQPESGISQTVQQGVTITGTVTDESGISVPGVTVLLEGAAVGVVSDANGKYAITVPDGNAVLVFSSIGYVVQQVIVGDQTVIDITLDEDARQLEEVVVIGYGTQRKVNLTGSIVTADSRHLENRPLTNASQALQGLTGLYVNQEGGQPGDDVATIRIRGIGTLGDNNPLVLVNGIEYSLKDINPEDIENISVLKDAASAAIYGNRAANGVILVTTKRGTQSRAH